MFEYIGENNSVEFAFSEWQGFGKITDEIQMILTVDRFRPIHAGYIGDMTSISAK